MTDDFIAELITDFHNGGDASTLDSVIDLAASAGYVVLPDGHAQAKGGPYNVEALLLPCDLSTWRTYAAAYNAGQNIFPTWFQYDASKDSFTYTESEFVNAFIKQRRIEKDANGFTMNGGRASDDDIKAALRESLAIVRTNPGNYLYSALNSLKALCPVKKSDQLFPNWYDTEHGKIKELPFVQYLVEKTGWKKAGRIVRTADGQIVHSDTVKQTIVTEIAEYCQSDTVNKSYKLFKLFMLLLPESNPHEKIEIISARELAQKDIKPPTFTVKDLLPVGLTVFAAGPKIGKSWLCLALADAVTSNQKFMGFDVTAGACLYMALEDGDYRFKQRLTMIGSAMPDRLFVTFKGALRLDDGLLMQLENWITETPDARLIVIDTLARVKPLSASGLDAYSQDTATIAPLQALALEHNVSIVLVTHYSKARPLAGDADPFERITGSNGLFGVADAAWLIYGKRGAEDMTFRTTGRDSMDNEFSITFDKETFRWRLLGTSEALEEQKRLDAYHASPLAQTIIELVNTQGRWEGTASELVTEVAARRNAFVGDAREVGAMLAEIAKYLLKLDQIIFSKAPGGKRGRAYSFERVKKF